MSKVYLFYNWRAISIPHAFHYLLKWAVFTTICYNKFISTLFINACPRKDSRTKILADYLLTKLNSNVQERNLTATPLLPLSEETLERRTTWADKNDFNHPVFALAKEFATADTIVSAAPFWDLSFPALLKIYLETST